MMLLNIPSFHKDFFRSLLGIINALCILTSLLVVVFVACDENLLKVYGDDVSTPDGNEMLLFASSLMLYAGIIGSYSAVRDNYKLLHEYICILIVMLAMMLPISLYVFLQRATLDLKTQLWLHEQFYFNITQPANNEATVPMSNHWDRIQDTYQCCGFSGPHDYVILQKPLTISCCPSAYRAKSKLLKKVLYNQCIITSSFVRVGCESKLQKSFQNDRYLLLGIAIVSFWFQFAGILAAMCIVQDLRRNTIIRKPNEITAT